MPIKYILSQNNCTKSHKIAVLLFGGARRGLVGVLFVGFVCLGFGGGGWLVWGEVFVSIATIGFEHTPLS